MIILTVVHDPLFMHIWIFLFVVVINELAIIHFHHFLLLQLLQDPIDAFHLVVEKWLGNCNNFTTIHTKNESLKTNMCVDGREIFHVDI